VTVREIVVATDFSKAAEAAVRVAHGYAMAFGARLHVVHVTWPDERDLTVLFARLRAELGSAVPVVTAGLRGDEAEEIVKYAELHAGDLIVLGTHGRTGFSRALLGSIAERVVRMAPCPVLTVPPDLSVRPGALVLPPSTHQCVVCGTMTRDLVCVPCRAADSRPGHLRRSAAPQRSVAGASALRARRGS
jgi:nucleotide-binding universal stress UspA family protein